ncbi:MAG TPA: exosortase/archaeosortase family protein [Terriglobales bacterium]|nr:exosortase/archaeosortase family protein [Terriglobales bacterium]
MAFSGKFEYISRLKVLLFSCVLTSLLLALFWVRLASMIRLWVEDGTYSLFALVPFVSLAIAYSKLKRTGAPARRACRTGLFLVACATAATALLDVGHIGFASLTPLLIAATVCGVVLGLYGPAMLRLLAFPLTFLLLLIPIPPLLLASIDFPLQEMCAKVTVFAVNVAGFHVQRSGTMILLGVPSLVVNVAPACDGVRSSLAMLFIAILYVYLLSGGWRKKALLLVAAVPLAYLGNFIRLLGDVCAVLTFGMGFWKYEQAWDYMTGFLIFLIPISLLFFLAKVMKCSRFRDAGEPISAAAGPLPQNASLDRRWVQSYVALAVIMLSGIVVQRVFKPSPFSNQASTFGTDSLARLPYKIGEYWGREAVTADCETARSGYGRSRVVCREYSGNGGDPLQLFIVPATVGVHSPDFCLRASGWVITNHRGGSSPRSPQFKFAEITAVSPSSGLAVCSYYWRSRTEIIGDDNPVHQWLRHVATTLSGRDESALLVEVCGQPANEREAGATSARVAKFTAEADPAVAQLFSPRGTR